MAINVEVPFEKKLLIPQPQEVVYAYLADVEHSIKDNFPGIEEFGSDGDEVYHWRFQKLEYSGIEFVFRVKTRFQFDAPDRISMTPVSDKEHSDFLGSWNLTEEGDKTELSVEFRADIFLPVPRLMKGVATPFLKREIPKLFDEYLANVEKNLQG